MFDADHTNHFFPHPSVSYHFLRPGHLRMANKALNLHDERAWLSMAETWLGMIPERQRTPNEFEKAVQKRGTRQEPSKSRH